MTDGTDCIASETLTPRLSRLLPFLLLPSRLVSFPSATFSQLLASHDFCDPEGFTEQQLTRQNKGQQP